MKKIDYEKDTYIDDTALDIEWLNQPALMMKYVQHAAEERFNMDKAKEELELIKAELDSLIRSKPEKFGINKITDAVVQNTIPLQKNYQKASEEYFQCKYEYDMAIGAVRAIEQRKDALENLVRLHGQQYFAGPKVPRNLTEQRKMKQEQVDSNIAKKINQRTRRK